MCKSKKRISKDEVAGANHHLTTIWDNMLYLLNTLSKSTFTATTWVNMAIPGV